MRRFPSIKKNSDFQTVYQEGKSYGNRLLVMYVLKQNKDESHLGVSCSKKVGNSVVRHTLTRKLREIFRIHSISMVPGIDIIIVVRKSAAAATYQEIEKAYLDLCSRHHIMKELK